MCRTYKILFGLMIAAGMVQASRAAVLVDQPVNYGVSLSTPSQEHRLATSQPDSEQFAFDNFSLDRKSRIDRIEWWGLIDPSYALPADLQFSLAIYSSETVPFPGAPGNGTALEVPSGEPLWWSIGLADYEEMSVTGQAGRPLHFSYDLDMPFTLEANDIYWLSIVATAENSDSLYFRWNPAISDPTDPVPYRWIVYPQQGAAAFVTYPCCTDSALRISGEAVVEPGVPEPASWAMLLTGFAAIGSAMRRRRPVASGRA